MAIEEPKNTVSVTFSTTDNTLGVVYSTGPYKTKEKELFFVLVVRIIFLF